LSDLQGTYQLSNHFLYDHRSAFLTGYGLDVYPLFIVVNHGRVIEEIMMGGLLPEEIKNAIKEGQ
jgi:hypothetical protein